MCLTESCLFWIGCVTPELHHEYVVFCISPLLSLDFSHICTAVSSLLSEIVLSDESTFLSSLVSTCTLKCFPVMTRVTKSLVPSPCRIQFVPDTSTMKSTQSALRMRILKFSSMLWLLHVCINDYFSARSVARGPFQRSLIFRSSSREELQMFFF